MASKYHTTKDGRKVRKGLWYYMNRRKKSGTSRSGTGTVSEESIERSRAKGGAWTRKEGQNPSGGLNAAGRASLKAQGKDIKAPQPEGGKRRNSFCKRMCGMKARRTSSKTANDPNSRINKSLRVWKCGSCSNWR